MKTVRIISKCFVCDLKIEWKLNVNEHGFFQVPEAYCPNDFTLMIQEIRGHIESIVDEDSNGS